MLLFTQLDNEKSALRYELDLLKVWNYKLKLNDSNCVEITINKTQDDMEEQRELLVQSRSECRALNADLLLKKRPIAGLEAEQQLLKHQIKMRDTLIHVC